MASKKSGNKDFRNAKPLITFFLFTLLLTGCVTLPDPESTQDYNNTSVAVVNPDQTAGQTFLSRRSRLNGIDLWLQTDNPGQLLTLELFHNIGDFHPIFTVMFSTTSGKIHLEIPPQADPHQ